MADAEVAAAEQLVLDAEDRAPLDGEVAAAHEAHRLTSGGPVERLGDGCPPVDDDRLGLLVGDRQAADVERLGRGRRLGHAVDAPEHEGGVAEVEVGEPLDERLVERVALEARLERPAHVGFGEISHAPRRLPRAIEALVRVVDVGLFGREFWVLLRHSSVWDPEVRSGRMLRVPSPASAEKGFRNSIGALGAGGVDGTGQ